MLVLDSAERLRQLLASDPAFKSPNMNQQCKVCNEPAAGFHFGAFTCEGCKSFFGRTYNNLGSINECKNNGECVINKKNRTSCKACRLRKCLMVGMSKSGSRYGRRSNWFKIHCLLQEQQQKQDGLVVNPNLGAFQLAHILRPKEDEECSRFEEDSRSSSERLWEEKTQREAKITSQDARLEARTEVSRALDPWMETRLACEPRLELPMGIPPPLLYLPPQAWPIAPPLQPQEQEHPIDLSLKTRSPSPVEKNSPQPQRASTPLDLTKRSSSLSPPAYENLSFPLRS